MSESIFWQPVIRALGWCDRQEQITSGAPLLSGNSRFIDLSGKLLGAHIAHAGLIMFWAGSMTLFEISRLNPNFPVYQQNLILLPHLATLGFGIGDGGQIVDTYSYYLIGMLHLISAAILGAGGIYHTVLGPEKLDEKGFGYNWQDGKKMTSILGIHLIFLGIGALLLVLKATRWGGLYDPLSDTVRLVRPNLDPGQIFGYLFGITPMGWNLMGMASVNNLEDLVGGHVWVGFLCIIGGIYHIVSEPLTWAKNKLIWSGEAYLSYSLGALALIGFSVAVFVSVNDLAYPSAFYGPIGATTNSVRSSLSSVHVGLGFIALIGHLWHAYRVLSFSKGARYGNFFDFIAKDISLVVPDNMKNPII